MRKKERKTKGVVVYEDWATADDNVFIFGGDRLANLEASDWPPPFSAMFQNSDGYFWSKPLRYFVYYLLSPPGKPSLWLGELHLQGASIIDGLQKNLIAWSFGRIDHQSRIGGL